MRNLVPEDLDRTPARPSAAKYLPRAAFAHARHALDGSHSTSAERIARALWKHDDTTPMILRGATSPATTTTSGWASQLAVSAVGDFVTSLEPISAGAKLLDAAVRVDLTGVNSISFPARSGPIDPDDVTWVAEGAPIPVSQFSIASATLGPMHRLAVIVTMTRESAEHGSGETVLTTLLRENAALALDASLFSPRPRRPIGRPDSSPAFRRYTAAAAGDDAAMAADLAALASAIGDNTSGLAFVMHPAQAAAVRLRQGTAFPADIPIWSTIAVAEGTVIALDPLALVSAFGAEPEITARREGFCTWTPPRWRSAPPARRRPSRRRREASGKPIASRCVLFCARPGHGAPPARWPGFRTQRGEPWTLRESA